MPMNNSERALATLVGEVHALYMAIQTLAKTHPNPRLAIAEFEIASQMGLASLEPHPVDEATIVGYQDVAEGIRRALLANPLYSR